MTAATQTTARPEYAPRRRGPDRPLRRHLTTGLAVLAPILFTISNVVPNLSGSTANVVRHIPAVADRLLAVHLLYTPTPVLYS